MCTGGKLVTVFKYLWSVAWCLAALTVLVGAPMIAVGIGPLDEHLYIRAYSPDVVPLLLLASLFVVFFLLLAGLPWLRYDTADNNR